MKNVLIILAFVALFSVGRTATSSGDYSDPDHPGKCVISPDVIVPPGTHQDPHGCARIECSESGYASMATCGVQGAGPGCFLGDYRDPKADYPDCCIREMICA